jgi:response regulator RpfG family c-di-GMP phosphodiesterase
MTTERRSILIVDDEEPVRRLLTMELSNEYDCTSAANAQEALQLLAANYFHLVLSDINMPGVSGLELCEFVREGYPNTVVVMVSGMSDINDAIEAMRQGAFDYVVKPFALSQLFIAVERALQHQSLVEFKQHHEELLEKTVRVRTNELRQLNTTLNDMLDMLYANYRATLRGLARALEARDVETRGHSVRVVAYCLRLGKELGLTPNELISLEQGAMLHDIGKIGVRDSILLKAGPLTKAQWVEMKEHINHGLAIIDSIDFLSGAAPVIGQHHEKFDGSGYPAGLSGKSIHMNARIFAVADALDAITSDRPYRAAQSYAQARAEIVASIDCHFDPEVVRAFLGVSDDEWADIRRTVVSRNYSDRALDTNEIRSFIGSLKGSNSVIRSLSRYTTPAVRA